VTCHFLNLSLAGDGDVTGETEEAADFKCRDWTDDSAACRSGLPILDRNHGLVSGGETEPKEAYKNQFKAAAKGLCFAHFCATHYTVSCS
jgi:hypothetical protein